MATICSNSRDTSSAMVCCSDSRKASLGGGGERFGGGGRAVVGREVLGLVEQQRGARHERGDHDAIEAPYLEMIVFHFFPEVHAKLRKNGGISAGFRQINATEIEI